MARINIEDSLFNDPRLADLTLALGSYELALGALVIAYKVAQKYWVPNKLPIPSVQFRSTRLRKEIIDVGLAEVTEDGSVYIKGSEEQFAWLIQRSKAGSKNKGKFRKRNRTKLNGTERLESSYSSSYSYSSSGSDSGLVSEGGANAPTPRAKGGATGEVGRCTWEAYSEGYRERYGTDPVRNATVNSQLSQLVKRLGGEAPEVVRFYLAQNRAFYLQSCHPIGLCLKDAEALRTQWFNNVHVLPTTARQQEQRAHNSDVWDRAAEALAAMKETKS